MSQRVIILTIPKASPSLNTINGQHWNHYRQQKRAWLDLIWVAKLDAGIYGMPMFERAKVSIERFGTRSLDVDNLTGGCKMLIDSLRQLGLIVDDSPAHIALTVTQRISKTPRTVIHVEQIAA
jgi:Holliday junction resolvase RusA-like endonuclease